jgi:hypothetical protein
MKITTITYMERKNKGNYEHEEISASANVDDGESFALAMASLKNAVHSVLHGIVIELPKAEVRNTPAEPKEENVEVITAIPVKAKRNATKKEKSEEITVIPVSDKKSNISEAPVAAPVGKNVVIYNRDLDTHRQLLSSYLNKNFPAWKTTEGVKEFSISLAGKHFLNDDGAVVESFAKLLSDFFNA